MATTALLNARVLAGENLQDGLAVLVRDGSIAAVLPAEQAESGVVQYYV